MAEMARKHGPFDGRYPVREKLPPPSGATATADGDALLDWSAFLAASFPNRHRHDFAAIAAYEAYTNERSVPAEPPAS